MRATGIILRVMTTTLFLLCMLVPQYAAAPSIQPVQNAVYFQRDVFSFLLHRLSTIVNELWGHQSLYDFGNDTAGAPSELHT